MSCKDTALQIVSVVPPSSTICHHVKCERIFKEDEKTSSTCSTESFEIDDDYYRKLEEQNQRRLKIQEEKEVARLKRWQHRRLDKEVCTSNSIEHITFDQLELPNWDTTPSRSEIKCSESRTVDSVLHQADQSTILKLELPEDVEPTLPNHSVSAVSFSDYLSPSLFSSRPRRTSLDATCYLPPPNLVVPAEALVLKNNVISDSEITRDNTISSGNNLFISSPDFASASAFYLPPPKVVVPAKALVVKNNVISNNEVTRDNIIDSGNNLFVSPPHLASASAFYLPLPKVVVPTEALVVKNDVISDNKVTKDNTISSGNNLFISAPDLASASAFYLPPPKVVVPTESLSVKNNGISDNGLTKISASFSSVNCLFYEPQKNFVDLSVDPSDPIMQQRNALNVNAAQNFRRQFRASSLMSESVNKRARNL